MRKHLPAIVALGMFFLLTVSWFGFGALRDRWDDMQGWDRRVHQGYERVVVGMTRSEVEGLMRSPGKKLAQFHLGQEGGFERHYAEAERSKSVYWLSWHNGIDYVYTVGFDERDRVTYKASGGT